MEVAAFARAPLDISDFPTRHNDGLALGQDRFAIIADDQARLGEAGGTGAIVRGR